MGRESSPDRQRSSVGGGGTGAAPTPANNVGGGAGWGDKVWMGGKEQGIGHADAPNAKSTMGDFLGLQDQKSRAEEKYLQRADLAEDNVKPMNDKGDPTCASEDHSFMGSKPGGSDALPGWETLKNFAGK